MMFRGSELCVSRLYLCIPALEPTEPTFVGTNDQPILPGPSMPRSSESAHLMGPWQSGFSKVGGCSQVLGERCGWVRYRV